jgi:predicted Zn-dependent protease with MMP-like domain
VARRKTGESWGPVLSERARRRQEFETLVAAALDELPEEFASRMDNVAVVVEDEPPAGQPLLGLYHGISQPDRGQGYAGVLPDVITIYRGPIERRARNAEELARDVRKTVWHEIAHHFGVSDARLHELGWD